MRRRLVFAYRRFGTFPLELTEFWLREQRTAPEM